MWIKICGLTTAAAVSAALEAGVDAIGFVFADSIRRVTPQLACELAAPARGRLCCVAVTRQARQDELDFMLATFAPDVLQADADDLRRVRLPQQLSLLPVLRAGCAPATPLPQRLLFDGADSGSGVVGDWSAASALARRTQLVLAGGLSASNVASAIRAVQPFGVDVSSGVEERRGIKSAVQIARFVDAARQEATA